MMAVAKAIGTTWSVEVDGKDHGSVYTDCDWRFGTLIEARDKFRRMRPDPYASRAPKSLLHVVSTVSQSVAHPRILPTPGVLYLGASRSAPFPATPPRCSREGQRADRRECGEETMLDSRRAIFQQREARPVLAGLHFGHERCSIATEWIQIDIMAGTTETAGAG